MMKRSRLLSLLLIGCLLLFPLACGRNRTDTEQNGINLYFLSKSGTGLEAARAVMKEELSMEELVVAVWGRLKNVEENSNYISPIPEEINLKSYSVEKAESLTLNLNSSYYELDSASQVLLRAALVKTFTQFGSINSVEILVDSQPITLPDGSIIGAEYANSFADVFDSGLNEYSQATVTVYFADAEGELLVPVSTDVVYKNNYPLEQYVITKLLRGPEDTENLRPVLAPDVQLLSVSTKNGVCHVNFNHGFMESQSPVSSELCIYSIVNSLTELNGIYAVQISVNGNSNLNFRNEISLEQQFQRNLDLVKTEETQSE